VKLVLSVIAAGVAALALWWAAAIAIGSGTARQTFAAATAPKQPPPLPPLASAVKAVKAELAGISQHGLALGPTSAPVTILEYADLLCYGCARAAQAAVGPVITNFVRSGSVQLEFEPIVESPRSDQFALGAYSAGLQRKGWDYVMLAYRRTTATSYGPVNAPAALASPLGLNLRRWRALPRRGRWANDIEQDAKVALLGNFTGYPVFIVRGPGIQPGSQAGRSVIVLRPPVTLTALALAIASAEPASS
jgi:hypothetical protein